MVLCFVLFIRNQVHGIDPDVLMRYCLFRVVVLFYIVVDIHGWRSFISSVCKMFSFTPNSWSWPLLTGLPTLPIFAEAFCFWSAYYACTNLWQNSRFSSQ